MMFGKPSRLWVYWRSDKRPDVWLEVTHEERHITHLFNSKKELNHSSQTSRGPAQ